MGHVIRDTKIVKITKKHIWLEEPINNGTGMYKINSWCYDIGFDKLKQIFKPGNYVVGNTHECLQDELNEGCWIKIISKEQYEYKELNRENFMHEYYFENKWLYVPEDEMCIIPSGYN